MSTQQIAELLTPEALRAVAPMLAISAGVLLSLLADIVPGARAARPVLFLGSLAAAFVLQISILADPPGLVLGGTYAATALTGAWGLIFVAAALVAYAFGRRYYDAERPFLSEHDVLMLCAVVGMMLMAGARDLLSFFIGLELLSVPLYALAGFRRADYRSVRAGMKYFLLGAFSAGLFLYGAGLAYAATGSIDLADLAQADGALFTVGVALMVASLFFKISVFPFHFWVPDVYQESPTPVTTFMATGTKAAGFAFLLNATFLLPRSALASVAAIAILTMAIGNLGALVQSDLKRLLGFSAVAHAGTVLLVVAGTLADATLAASAARAAVYYMAAYVFTAGGAFGLIALLESDGEHFTRVDALRGLWRRRPGVAAAMTLFMLSLAGIPATGGFLGKWLVFAVLVDAGLVPVAVIGVLLSVVAVGYYLRVVVAMTMQPEPEDQSAPTTRSLYASLATGLCAFMVVLLGLLPGWLLGRLP